MGYQGNVIPIPLGGMGLRTDDPSTSLPPNALVKANNVSFYSGKIEKTRGSTKINSTALPSTEVVAIFDWWPTPALQRTIAVTSDGKIWRDTGDGTFSSNTAIKNLAVACTTDTHIVQGGQEESGRDKRLFIFTGTAQIQEITGDGATTNAIATPNTNWSAGNYPTFGVVYANRLCVMGSATDRHTLYFSLPDDHEDFNTGTPLLLSVFPGEGDGIKCAVVYRGLLFVFKEPYGVYVVDGRDPSSANWTVQRYSDAFGVQSPHAVLQVLTDLVAANSFGSFTSLQASDQFGDFEAGDILANNSVENYFRDIFNNAGLPFTQSVYYPDKRTAFFTAQADTDDVRDLMLVMDASRPQLRLSVNTKDQANCLALRRDSVGVQRPMYGDKSGFVWLMDQSTYNVDGTPYLGEFQTAYADFGFVSPDLASKNKVFDFLEVDFVPTGNNNFFCDVFVDNQFRQTLTFSQVFGVGLDNFELDVDAVSGGSATFSVRKQLKSCTGKKISFRFYNNGFNEGFKIEKISVSLTPSGEQTYASQVE
jgi:hypothetical protein